MYKVKPINNHRFDVFRGKELYLVSALYDALEGGSVSHLKTILERTDANPNEILPRLGVSPFHLAIGNECENFAEEVTTLFLQFGGNPNGRSVDGQTPVHIAAAWGRANLLKLLLINGGDPWLCDEDNNNAFHLAFRERHWKVIELLKTFRLEDLEKEEDLTQQKYIMTLDKVHLYNKNIAIEYDQEPQNGSVMNCKRSVATQTCKNAPNTSLVGSNGSYIVKEAVIKKQVVNSQVAKASEIPVVKNNMRVLKNKSSEIHLQDEKSCIKMQNKSNNVKRDSDTSNKHCIFPNRSLKEQLLEELTKFHTERNKKRLNSRESTIRNADLSESIKNEVLHIGDSNSECNNPELMEIFNSNGNIANEVNTVVGDASTEISNMKSGECVNLNNLQNNDRKEIACSSNVLFDCHLDITDDLSYEEEWTASHSCFVLLDESDYTTCNDDFPDIQTIEVPLECKQNVECSTHQNSLTSTSSSESFVSVTEEYKYSDVEEGVVLLEKRFLVPPVSISYLQAKQRKTSEVSSTDNGVEESLTSDSSSIPSSLDYDTDVLRKRLKERGFVPGPIIPSTKKLYLRKLVRLEKNPVKISTQSKVYSVELQRTLCGFNWSKWLAVYLKLEKEIVVQFSQPEPGRRWREGNIKSSFTYLLLDSRVTENLPCRIETLNKLQVWSLFLSAIFYVGKGKRSRPYSHLYQAFSMWNRKIVDTDDKKVQYILDIWKAGMGVVCLHVYQNVIPVEAYTREAAMIDALGLRNVKNARCGEYYGVASTWTSHQKRMLGTFLLYRAMLIFLQEGERQLRPGDIG